MSRRLRGAKVEQRRQDTANTLHFACKVFGDEYIRRLSRGLWHIQRPLRMQSGNDMQTAKPFDVTLEFALANIGREYNMTLRDTARQIFTPSVLADLCFPIGFDDPNLVSDEALLAEKRFWYTISL